MSYGRFMGQLPARESIGACSQFKPVTIIVNANNWSGSGFSQLYKVHEQTYNQVATMMLTLLNSDKITLDVNIV